MGERLPSSVLLLLCAVFLSIAAFVPIEPGFTPRDDGFNFGSATEAGSWVDGLSIVALVVSILLALLTSTAWFYIWFCLMLAGMSGVAFNAGSSGMGAVIGAVLLALVAIPGIWTRAKAAREAASSASARHGAGPMSTTDLREMRSQVDAAIRGQSTRGASDEDIKKMEQVRDELDRQIRALERA